MPRRGGNTRRGKKRKALKPAEQRPLAEKLLRQNTPVEVVASKVSIPLAEAQELLRRAKGSVKGR